jgi:hypothetical protein
LRRFIAGKKSNASLKEKDNAETQGTKVPLRRSCNKRSLDEEMC